MGVTMVSAWSGYTLHGWVGIILPSSFMNVVRSDEKGLNEGNGDFLYLYSYTKARRDVLSQLI